MGQIQNGMPITKNGVTITPVDVGGEQVWQPSIPELAGMGYLPPGWSATVSTLNNAPYSIAFKRYPAGCVVAACNIEGHVVLNGPIRGGAAASDGAVIGPILTRIGADSGVSLPMDPTRITGFGNTWTLPNPVPGQPAGVVAIRVGTASSAFGQFVRIGDIRDPDLAGNLTVAGNTLFGDGTTTSEFRSTVLVDGHAITVRDAAGNSCVSLRADGILDVACNGVLNVRTGTFADGAGNTTAIGPAAIVATGAVSADGGFHTQAVDAFAAADANAIVVKAGDLFIRNPAGTALLRVAANGDVASGNDLVANGNVQARQLTLTASVEEGDSCSGQQVAMMSGGGLATCQGSRFRATTRYASLGAFLREQRATGDRCLEWRLTDLPWRLLRQRRRPPVFARVHVRVLGRPWGVHSGGECAAAWLSSHGESRTAPGDDLPASPKRREHARQPDPQSERTVDRRGLVDLADRWRGHPDAQPRGGGGVLPVSVGSHTGSRKRVESAAAQTLPASHELSGLVEPDSADEPVRDPIHGNGFDSAALEPRHSLMVDDGVAGDDALHDLGVEIRQGEPVPSIVFGESLLA
jgi:hypothetical protein